jgi:hypothetical protein
MPESFEDMRRDAVRRVMEMQARAEGLTGGGQAPTPEPSASSGVTHSSAPAPGGSLADLLSGLNIDEEKALIALLIYILWKNGADKKLLFGLGYLIL